VTIVRNTLSDPGQAATVNRPITVRLASAGFRPGDESQIVSVATVRSDAAGSYELDLVPNSQIDPAGTHYVIAHPDGTLWPIVVPDGSGPFWLRDILTEDPAAPGAVIAGLSEAQAADAVATPGGVLSNALAAAFVTQPAIDAALYGLTEAGSAAANLAALQAAVNAGVTAQRNVSIPPGGFDIGGTITVPAPGGIAIYGQGRNKTTLHQTIKPNAVFDVTGPSVDISDIEFVGDGLDMSGMGTPINYARYVGVWLDDGSSGSSVSRVRGVGLHRVVRVDPGSGYTPAQRPNISNVTIADVESDRCWAGVTGCGMTDCVITGVRGTYLKAFSTDGTDTGQPPHLIYIIDRLDPDLRANFNVQVSDCMAWDSVLGKAYSIKGMTGGAASNMYARNCAGLIDLFALTDWFAAGLYSVDDSYPQAEAYGSITVAGASERVTVDGAQVRFAAVDHGPGYYIQEATDCIGRDIEVVGNRLTDQLTANSGRLFDLKATRNQLVNPVASNIGAGALYAGIQTAATGDTTRIANPITRGNLRHGVNINAIADAVVEYDPLLLGFNSGLAGARAVQIQSNVVRPVIRPRGKSPAGLADLLLWETGLGLTSTGASPARASSGQLATIIAGTWSTVSGLSKENASNGGGVLAWPLAGYPNVHAEVKVKFGVTNPAGRIGVAVRAVDAANFVAAGYTTAGFTLITRTAGVDAVVATAAGIGAPVTGRIYCIAIECFGSLIEVFLDGAKVITYTLSAPELAIFGTAENHGYYANRCANSLFYGATIRTLA